MKINDTTDLAFEKPPQITLGDKELDELAMIFSDHPKNEHEEIKQSAAIREMTQIPNQNIREKSMKSDANQSFVDSIKTQVIDKIEKHSQNDSEPVHILENKINGFQLSQSELMTRYILEGQSRSTLNDNFLYVLNGLRSVESSSVQNENAPLSRLLSEQTGKTTGGIYLKWHGKGIVINPGKHFLDNFHKHGLHILDIDFVIVTRDVQDTYTDVKGIHDLNYKVNSASPELHIIHYYFNYTAYQKTGRTLKPHFKQERNTIHCLELYIDSPDVEKIEINDTITLNYFPGSSNNQNNPIFNQKETQNNSLPTSLGICLELKSPEKSPLQSFQKRDTIRLGYISGTAWSPLFARHLNNCDLLICGFEKTQASDYSRLSYQEDCLGYYGIYSLLEETSPHLLLCSEFLGHEGDIRMEVAKKMRQEYSSNLRSKKQPSVILPADTGLNIDLKSLKVQCSVSKIFVDPAQIKVVKLAESFGNLHYISSACLL